ncbi:hypothetical protein TNCV_5008261 [Trichonephila clavipes]|nr:hypothetical protein TNCV_5008261 [Trichonephila clavipes]
MPEVRRSASNKRMPHTTHRDRILYYLPSLRPYGQLLKVPTFPKPRKGKTTKNNYTTVVDSIVRPNITYAQATNIKKPDQNKNTQQMAPQVNDAPAISSQNQTNRSFNKPPTPTTQEFNLIENSPQFAIVQTLQQTMQTLAILTQQIASLNFNALAPSPPKKSNKAQKKKELSALIEAILDHDDDD